MDKKAQHFSVQVAGFEKDLHKKFTKKFISCFKKVCRK